MHYCAYLSDNFKDIDMSLATFEEKKCSFLLYFSLDLLYFILYQVEIVSNLFCMSKYINNVIYQVFLIADIRRIRRIFSRIRRIRRMDILHGWFSYRGYQRISAGSAGY